MLAFQRVFTIDDKWNTMHSAFILPFVAMLTLVAERYFYVQQWHLSQEKTITAQSDTGFPLHNWQEANRLGERQVRV